MTGLQGFTALLVLQTLGEVLVRLLGLPLPGPVLGLLLLLPALAWAPLRQPVAQAADFLLAHLSLLFVPVGVGVVSYLPLLGQYGLRMLLVLVLSTWVGLAVTALVLHKMGG